MKPIFALALMAASALRADTIVQTLSFNIQITDATNLYLLAVPKSQTLNFNLFNPTLGTLTSVDYTLLNSTTTRNLTVTGSRNSGTVNSSSIGTTSGTVNLVGGPLLLPAFLHTITATCTGSPSCSASPTLSDAVTGTQNIGALGSYIGFGTVDATLRLGAGRSFPLGTPIVAAGLSRTANIDANWSGDLQLVYTYTPNAAVPEPSVWAPFALSGVLLASRSLRRRK